MEQDTLSIFQKIAPDVMGTIKERYLLLRHIADAEPVGRRTLAGLSGLSERVVRSHVDVLRRSGIVRFTTLGIAMEPEGKRLMPDLLECFLRLNNLDDMQRQIRQKLGLKNVYIPVTVTAIRQRRKNWAAAAPSCSTTSLAASILSLSAAVRPWPKWRACCRNVWPM